MRIDLNCDLGESFGPWKMGSDEEVMASITSANVACGFHAGDPSVMRNTIRLARERGVAVGAHPGFQDLAGFGRRDMAASPNEVEDLVLYQIAAIAGVAAAEGIRLQHVKAHGALYNMAAKARPLADAIARATAAFDRSLVLFGLPNSALLDAGRDAGLRVAAEAFADRSYEADGSLTSRRLPHAIVHDPDLVVERVLRMARDGTVVASDGTVVSLQAETVCVHGDTPGAAGLVKRLRAGLERAGVSVQPIGRSPRQPSGERR